MAGVLGFCGELKYCESPRAVTNCDFLSVPTKHYIAVALRTAARNHIDRISTRLHFFETQFLSKSHSIFGRWTLLETIAFCELLIEVILPKYTVLVKQGEFAETLFFVHDGSIGKVVAGHTHITTKSSREREEGRDGIMSMTEDDERSRRARVRARSHRLVIKVCSFLYFCCCF